MGKFNLGNIQKLFNRRIIGKNAELIALKYLQEQGLKLIKQNFYCRDGEIDLIMRDKESLVFVEVRYRQDSRYGTSSESISFYKKQRIIKTAWYYLYKKKILEKYPCRFDVVALTCHNYQPEIEWIKDAFQL